MIRAYFSRGYWRFGFSWTKALTALLASFGTEWLLVQIANEFGAERLTKWLQQQSLPFFAIGVLATVWINRPRHTVIARLSGRDTRVEICVGDVFSFDSGLIVGCNTTFDTDLSTGLISAASVQGQFTTKYYDSVAFLDVHLDDALRDREIVETITGKPGKTSVYAIGTTAVVRARNRTTYLVAIARMTSSGNAAATFEDLKTSLPALWTAITERGDSGEIAMPVLGSGLARITAKREEIICEIIRSFVAACADQKPCEYLRIVIAPRDFYGNEINLSELQSFLEHVCKYTPWRAGATGRGTALPN